MIEQAINAPVECIKNLRSRLLYVGYSGHIGNRDKGTAALLPDPFSCPLCGILVDVNDGNLRAFFGKKLRTRATSTGRTARNNDIPIFESPYHHNHP